MAVEDDKNKNFAGGRTGGRTDGITLRGPRGPKKRNQMIFLMSSIAMRGTQSTVVSHVGGRPFWMKNFKCIFLVSLASLGAERSGKIDFRTPEAQKTEKMLSQMGSYVHFTV